MIEILEPGSFKRVVNCPNCNCKFTFDKRTDILDRNRWDWGQKIIEIECPFCNEIFELWRE